MDTMTRTPRTPRTPYDPYDPYERELQRIPVPGSGDFHRFLLTPANYGRIAGLDSEQVIQDILTYTPPTDEDVEHEVRAAVDTAFCGADMPCDTPRRQAGLWSPKSRKVKKVQSITRPEYLQKIIAKGQQSPFGEADIWEWSPVPAS